MSEDKQRELSEQAVTQETIAEEFAEKQQQTSVAEFFAKNKQMLGFDSRPRALFTTIKEAVDNSLDAAEEAGIFPSIYVSIEKTSDGYYLVTVRDNGPGITEEQIPKVFGRLLYGSRFHTREQSRGQQGIGISAAVLNAQQTTGKPSRIISREKGREEAYQYELIIDEEQNRPDIRSKEETDWDYEHGTEIKIELDANLRARKQIHKYIRYTALVNPHARIEFHEPKEDFIFEQSSDKLPPETSEIDPHPHGVELGTLMKMIRDAEEDNLADFLQNKFVRVGPTGAENIISNFKDHYYGREGNWKINISEEIETELNQNGIEQYSKYFTSFLAERLNEIEYITYSEVKEVVDEMVDYTETEVGERIGSSLTGDETRWVEKQTQENATLDQWTDGDTNPLVTAIKNSVSQKDASAVKMLAESVVERIMHTRVSIESLGDIVEEEADKVEQVTGETFGRTAQQNIVEAVWETIPERDDTREQYLEAVWEVSTNGRSELISEWFDEETSVQKDDEAVQYLSQQVGERLKQYFPERFTYSQIENVINSAADATEEETEERFGDTSRSKLMDRLWEEMKTPVIDAPSLDDLVDDRNACQALLRGMKKANVIAPPTDCLAPIGKEELETGLETVYDNAEFITANTRDADVYSGDPFVVEAGIAYGPQLVDDDDNNKAELLRFANKVPLVYQEGACSSTDVVKRIKWRNYFKGSNKLSQSGDRGIPHGPMVIVVHVASTNVPFTSESKDAIANVESIEDEIELAIRESARELKSHLSEKKDRRDRQRKLNQMTKIFPDIADKLSDITENDNPGIARQVAAILNNTYIGWENDTTLHINNHQGKSARVRVTVAYNDSVDEDDIPDDVPGEITIGDRRSSEINDSVDNRRVTGQPSTFIIWDVELKRGQEARLNIDAAPNKKYVVGVDEIVDEKVTIQDWM